MKSTPCKAFGHTEGRYRKGNCIICVQLYLGIKHNMNYWGNRMILGLSSLDSVSASQKKSMLVYRKSPKCKAAKDKYDVSPKGVFNAERKEVLKSIRRHSTQLAELEAQLNG